MKCRLCGDVGVRCLGDLPRSDYFAGRVLQYPIEGGRLWACDACQSMFRHPVLPNSVYLQLYANGAGDEWSVDDGRQDFAIIRQIIAQRDDCRSVLDVGCGAGNFLSALPSNLERYGVEPSLAAASAARRSGLRILAETLADLSPGQFFDAITVIDVIEHVDNPKELLDAALRHLSRGGVLIIATGDPANGCWRRIFKGRFWYASFAEHITFPSLRFFDIWRAERGMESATQVKFKYRRLSLWKAAPYLASQMAFFASPMMLNCAYRGIAWAGGVREPRRQFYSPGGPGVFTDHQIVTIRRPR